MELPGDDWARYLVAEKRPEAPGIWTLRLVPEDGGDVPRGSVIHVDHAMGELTYLVRTTSTAGG